jgi:hypothetical protein
MGSRYTPLDANLLFGEDKTLTASSVVKDGNSNDVVLNIGTGRMDFDVVVDVTTLDISSNDEKYTFLLQGCNDAAFAGVKENLGVLELGAAAVRTGGAKASTIGRYIMSATTDMLTNYKYVRLNVLIAGTTPSILFSSWLSPRS